jgi:hypothetical protein
VVCARHSEDERQYLKNGAYPHEGGTEFELAFERELSLGRTLDVKVPEDLLRSERRTREQQTRDDTRDSAQKNPRFENGHQTGERSTASANVATERSGVVLLELFAKTYRC